MKQKRIRIGRLDTAGGIAYEHGKILKKLMREIIDPQLATRLSGMFVNQRVLIEYVEARSALPNSKLARSRPAKQEYNVIPMKARRG